MGEDMGDVKETPEASNSGSMWNHDKKLLCDYRELEPYPAFGGLLKRRKRKLISRGNALKQSAVGSVTRWRLFKNLMGVTDHECIAQIPYRIHRRFF